MNDDFARSISEAWGEFLHRLADVVPDLLVLLAILALGVLAGIAGRLLAGRLLRLFRFDRLAERAGLTALLRRAGIAEPPSEWLANLAGWAVLAGFLLVGAASLRIPGTGNLVAKAFEFLPALLVAGTVLLGGLLLAQFLARAALVAAVNAEVESARALATGVRLLVGLLAVAMTFEQLGVARGVVVAAFSILFGGVVLALAIAFGLGGRHLARRFLETRFPLPPRKKAGTELEPL